MKASRALGENLKTPLRKARSYVGAVVDSYRAGVSVNTVRRNRDCFITIRELLRHHKPEVLCDVGANVGGWTRTLQQLSPTLREAVLFEPQKSYSEELKALALPNVRTRLYTCGLSDRPGTAVIKGGSASASFLDAAAEQSECFPGSIENSSEMAELRRLDEVYATDALTQPDTVKIDVQGYELHVLKGAVRVLAKTRILILEISFRPFYEGQPPNSEIFQFLEDNNFRMIGRGFELKTPAPSYELAQMDGIFLNTRYPVRPKGE